MLNVGATFDYRSRSACRADAQQFCSDVKPGNGSIADCMKSHAVDLSEGCRAAIAKDNGGERDARYSPSSRAVRSAVWGRSMALSSSV